MILAFAAAIPAASASDNPSFAVPGPEPLTDGAGALAAAVADDANGTASENRNETVGAAVTLKESIENAEPEVPLENLTNIVDNTFAFAERSILGAYGFGALAEQWTFDEAMQKIEELDHAGNVSHISLQHYATGAINLGQTAMSAVCRDSVFGGANPTDCEEESLAGQSADSGANTANEAKKVVENQKENLLETAAHVAAEVQRILCSGPCAP